MLISYYFIGLLATGCKRYVTSKYGKDVPKGTPFEELFYWLVYSPLTWPLFVINLFKN